MFYQTTVTLPISRMNALISLLEKVQIQTQDKKMSDANLLALRLAPDMFPLSKQIQIVSDNAKGMASRLTLQETPKYEDNEVTLSDLISRLTKTIAYLETFSESDFANAATSEARFPYFPGKHMVGADYIFGYAIPNFFFHLVTVYAILRHHGFDIGKADYMGQAVPLLPDAV
jgi:hypothetical protein